MAGKSRHKNMEAAARVNLTGIWPSCLNVVYGRKPPFDIPSVTYGHHSTFRIMKNTKPPSLSYWHFCWSSYLMSQRHVGGMRHGYHTRLPWQVPLRFGAQVFPSSRWPGLWTAGSWMGSARPPEAPKPTATTATRRGIDRWSREAGVWGKISEDFGGKPWERNRKWET
jgi:hypothetical protein